ncbi:MAG: ribbon-helix-helix protein, CopG family [Deltaproteobacteria bacterium]|nr:ribbon-helix-helix protein, CopG family [Deltaproteobacteria bacterium]
MPRTTRTITVSLPPEMMGMVERLTKKEGRTKSELIREALRRYAEEREWRDLFRYAERQAKRKRITEDQIEILVDDIRN